MGWDGLLQFHEIDVDHLTEVFKKNALTGLIES